MNSYISFILTSTLLAVQFSKTISFSIDVTPGMVLSQQNSMIVVFEVSEHGVGGLVYNRPSPIRLKDLGIPKFASFGENFLMMGQHDLDSPSATGNSVIALGEMAPWFWLHNIHDLSESSSIIHEKGGLYMGGNIDQASILVEQGHVEPSQVKFFYKYTILPSSSVLQESIETGRIVYEGTAADHNVLSPFQFLI